jgi:hypothetical protein
MRGWTGRIIALAEGVLLGGAILVLPRTLLPAGSDARSSGPARTVRRAESPTGVRLSYEWTDAAGRQYAIELPIPRSELEASEQALGFSLTELRTFLVDAEVRIREEEGLTPVAIARGVVSRISDPDLCQIGEDPDSAFNIILRTNAATLPGGASEVDRILAAYQRRWDASRKTVCERLQARLREYAGAHGMEVTPHGIAVDYKRLVKDSAVRLRPLAQEFRRRCGPPKQGLLAAVHSFVQSIPYEQNPPVDGGRYTAGVEVPLRVLTEDRGDCDSKAVLFAALWINLSHSRTILIQVPEHMLVGVAAPFVSGESLVIQSIRYLLLEMSCREIAPPGRISVYSAGALAGGDFKYKIVS